MSVSRACALVALASLAPLAGARAQPQPSEVTGPIDAGELYRRLRDSFVVIRCGGERFGTGFGFGRVGRVATARHVVACPRGLAAELGDGTILPVRVVGIGGEHDIALVELVGEAGSRVPPLSAREGAIAVGSEVVSIGFPVGPEVPGEHELAVTRGIVAQRTEDRLVHDALISPGSSGGPLLDRDGRVVGVSYAVPRGSSVGLAVPVVHLVELHESTPADAGDPRDPFHFGLDLGLSYELGDGFHFGGVELALWGTLLDQVVATLRGVVLYRFPRTLEDGGVYVEGNRFLAELDAAYRLRFDGFPLVFELAGGVSIGNDHVEEARTELMLVDPSCDPAVERCAVRTFGVRTSRDDLLARPLAALRVTIGPLSLVYSVLFDVERIEATAHRITLRVGLF